MTPQDHAAWQSWRKARKLEQQRERRAKLRRIDYHPSAEVAAIVDKLMASASRRHAYAELIDALVLQAFRNKQTQSAVLARLEQLRRL